MVNEVESVLGLGVLTVSVYLGAVAATLCSGLLKNTAATLICLVVQCVAMWYYSSLYHVNSTGIAGVRVVLRGYLMMMCSTAPYR